MNSAIFTGWVRHRRHTPVAHAFRYRLFQLYLDLDELPHVLDKFWLWSGRRPAVAWFRRKDHFGDPERALVDCVRDAVQAKTGVRPCGPIRMLTHLRYFGFAINPVSYFYCFGPSGQFVQSVLAEVHNTPWGERHCYVIDSPVRPESGTAVTRWSDKAFHVSPFMPMNMRYRWRLSQPAEHLTVMLENHLVRQDPASGENAPRQDDGSVSRQSSAFDVTMHLHRQPLTAANLRRMLVQYPLMTARVALAIYWQALRLKLKGVPFYGHPSAMNPADVIPEATDASRSESTVSAART